MASSTPSRPGRPAGGYYADPSSPIASAPKTPGRPAAGPKLAPVTPGLATRLESLSPMKASAVEHPKQRHLPTTAAPEETKHWGIFSPVFKFFSSDEESSAAASAAAVPSASSASTSSTASAPRPAAGASSAASSRAAPSASPASPSAPPPLAMNSRLASSVSSSGTHTPEVGGSVGGYDDHHSASAGGAAAMPPAASPPAKSAAAVASGIPRPTASAAAAAASSTPAALRPHNAAASAAAAQATMARTPSSSSSSAAAVAAPSTAVAVTRAAAPAPAAASSADGSGSTAAEGEGSEYYEYEEFDPYLFIKMLPTYHSVCPIPPRVCLPRKGLKKANDVSLVLDLDETLVHCSVEPIDDADVTFPVVFNGQHYQVWVRKRPYLDRFLAWVAARFEVVIFTASQQVYAERLLSILDPDGRLIDHKLYRDSCLNVDGNYLKDLNVLGRELHRTVLVDNSPHAFGYQLDNGIPIESWFDDRADTELLKLIKFLETIQHASDVRPAVREKFKVHRLVANAHPPPGMHFTQ